MPARVRVLMSPRSQCAVPARIWERTWSFTIGVDSQIPWLPGGGAREDRSR